MAMRYPDPDAWTISDHAARRYCERLAPKAEPLDLLGEPGMVTARARVRNLLRGDLLLVGMVQQRARVCPDPRSGVVLVCDEHDRHVITLYLAEGKERLRLEQKISRRREVERQTRRYRYAYAAPGRRWPGWLR